MSAWVADADGVGFGASTRALVADVNVIAAGCVVITRRISEEKIGGAGIVISSVGAVEGVKAFGAVLIARIVADEGVGSARGVEETSVKAGERIVVTRGV